MRTAEGACWSFFLEDRRQNADRGDELLLNRIGRQTELLHGGCAK